jgi:hypothetical protein
VKTALILLWLTVDFPVGCASAIDCRLLSKVLNKVLMHFKSAS